MLIESWFLSHYKDRFSDIRTPIIKRWRSSDRVNFIIILISSLAKSCLYCLIEAEWRIYASVNWAIIGSDNGMSPGRRQAIIWTNAGILSIRISGTNFREILVEIHIFHSRNALKKSSGKWWPFCLGFNVLRSRSDRGYVMVIRTYPSIKDYKREKRELFVKNIIISYLNCTTWLSVYIEISLASKARNWGKLWQEYIMENHDLCTWYWQVIYSVTVARVFWKTRDHMRFFGERMSSKEVW